MEYIKPKVIPKIAPIVLLAPKPALRVKEIEKLKPRLEVREKISVVPRVTPFEAVKFRELVGVKLRIVQRIIPRVKPKVVPRFVPTVTPRPPVPKPKIKPPIIPPYFRFPSYKAEIRRKRLPSPLIPRGFRVEVRKRGEFIPLIGFGVPKGEALWLGRKAVKAGAAATFRLVPTAKAKPLGVPRITERYLLPEFRKPIRKGREIREPFLFIQKRAFRIKTPGELREITFRGIAARRRKAWWL